MRLAFVTALFLSLTSNAWAQSDDLAAAAPTFEYCARVVSAGAGAIESEAEGLGLSLSPPRPAAEAPAFGNVVRQLFQGDGRVRIAAPVDDEEYVLAIVDVTGQRCLAGVGPDDAVLLQHLRNPASEWQFAFTDGLTGASVFDWPGVEGGESVRALRFRPIRSDPVPSTFHERAPFAVSPPISEEVRRAWVSRILEMCLASAHEGVLPSVAAFDPYLAPSGTENGVAALVSARGQPPAQLWIGANDFTCSLSANGEHGRLLHVAFEAELRRLGGAETGTRSLGFTFARPVGARHGASVLLHSRFGVHAVIVTSDR